MKRFLTSVAAVTLAASSMAAAIATPAAADPHHKDNRGYNDRGYKDHHDNGRHNGWHKGGRIDRSDWNRGHRVDYRRHHLRAPPRGYEWRQVDNNYVLAAVATGLIASILIANQ